MLKKILAIHFIFILSSSLFAITLKDVIKKTLENDFKINIVRENINYYQGKALEKNTIFDNNINISSDLKMESSQSNIYINNNSKITNDYNYKVSTNKYFQNGFLLTGGFAYNESHIDSSNTPTISSSQIFFTLNKELLRNSSAELINADIKSSKYDIEIAKEQFKIQINNSLYNSISNYWNLLYAYEKSKLDLESKKNADKLIENIEELIKFDSKPKADIYQARANLNSKVLNLLTSKETLSDTTYELNKNIGSSIQNNSYTQKPDDYFPIPKIKDLQKIKNKSFFNTLISNQNEKLTILKYTIKKLELDLLKSNDNLKSNFDVTLQTKYSGNNRTSNPILGLNTLSNNDVNGKYIGITFKYELPIQNSFAKGNIISNRSKIKQKRVELDELKNELSYNLHKLLFNIETTILRFEEITYSINNYEEALKNEKLKYTMGLSTILDIIQTNDNLYSEKIKRLSTLKDYALKILELHYITSSITKKDLHLSVDYNKFFLIK